MDDGSLIPSLQFYKEPTWSSNRVWLSSPNYGYNQQVYQIGYLGNIDYSWVQFIKYEFNQRPALLYNYQIFLTSVELLYLIQRLLVLKL